MRRRRSRHLTCCIAIALTWASGCGNTHGSAAPSSAPRVVSLAPSLTEIAYAIGCGGELAADTSFDDYPPAARDLPHVADLTHVDLERLAQIGPTAVLALHDEEKAGSEIVSAFPGMSITYLPNRNLDDLYADITGVGAICNRSADAAALRAKLSKRIGEIARQANAANVKPRVLYLLGLPGFTAGKPSFVNDLIGLAGGINIAGGLDQAYPDLSAEAIVASRPDVVIVAHDTPFGADVRAREPWRSLEAVRDGRVVTVPDDDLVERLGPRTADGLAWLESVIGRR
jgi:ABC-type Fe3+-hydroxamate transport system substrate-binding protein